MKKRIVLLSLAALFIGNTALAIVDTGENSLGVYFDAGTFEENCIDAPYLEFFSMFFVMANCTQPSIGGFEFAWAIDPDPAGQVLIVSAVLPLQALNIGDNFNFIVGLGTPLATGPATVLVELQLFSVIPDLMGHITLGPVTPSSIPGRTAFVDGIDYEILLPMNYSTLDGVIVNLDNNGWVRPGVATFSCPGPVAIEQSSWGSVKALFN